MIGPKLFIGPYVGEFGVEVLRWQGLARRVAHSRDWGKIVVAGLPDRQFLYADFAGEYIGVRQPTEHALGYGCEGNQYHDLHKDYIDAANGDVCLMPRTDMAGRSMLYGMTATYSTYRNFSEGLSEPDSTFDLLVHARASTKSGQHFKNWSIAEWDQYLKLLPGDWRIGSIGSPGAAHKLTGTTDLRGISLEELARYCKAAKLVVGPSSGAIHYAMHCGCPVVTWVDNDPNAPSEREHSRCNYYPQWNPWSVETICLTGWHPSPDVVHLKTTEILSIIRSRKALSTTVFIGTKRSGHHALIEWFAAHSPGSFVHLNDCVSDQFETFPPEPCRIPSRSLIPKTLCRASTEQCVYSFGDLLETSGRIISIEGIPIEKVASIPEVKAASRIVFVLRDALNTAASLKAGIEELRGVNFLHSAFKEQINIYRGYLMEALGHTAHLSPLSCPISFISYNRWHLDPKYRTSLLHELVGVETPERDVPANQRYFASGFQGRTYEAKMLKTLSRWRQFQNDEGLWNLSCSQDLGDLERRIHGQFCFASLGSYLFDGRFQDELPEWA